MLDQSFKIIDKLIPAKYRWILNHEGFRRYFANTGWMFFGQMFSLLASFFVGAWLARYLGPENYGVINYTSAFAGLFSFIASLGVDSILTRELVKTPEKRDELMGTSLGLKLMGGGLASIMVIAAAFIFETSPINRLFIIIFSSSLIFQALNVIYYYFQAEVKAKYNALSQFGASLISLIFKVAFILSGVGLIWIVIIFAADIVWQAIFFIYQYRRQGLSLKKWQFNQSLARQILNSSWFLMLSSAASFILLKIDQVMIGKMLGEGAVGLYAVAVKFGEIWYFLPGIFCASLFPAIIKARQISQELYQQRLRNFYLLMLIISVFIALGTTILAKPAVLLLFGSDYLLSIPILKIYVWSGVGLFLGWAFQQRLMAEDRLRTIFVAYFVAMLLNIVLNLIFIHHFGTNGAAWATLISYALLPVMMCL